MMCNYMVCVLLCDTFVILMQLSSQGNERWLEELDTVFLDEFSATKPAPWIIANSGELAGELRSAGGSGLTAGNVTFVNVYQAG